MFKKSRLNNLLKQLEKNRKNYFFDELNNILFLDFDGVINLNKNN